MGKKPSRAQLEVLCLAVMHGRDAETLHCWMHIADIQILDRTVQALDHKGWITSTWDHQDDRWRSLTITQAGRTVCADEVARLRGLQAASLEAARRLDDELVE